MNIATHAVTPEEVMALVDAELSAERAQVVARHLDNCVSCGSVAKTLRGSSDALANWIVPAAPAQVEVEAGLLETVRRVSGELRERPRWNIATARSFLRGHWVVVSVAVASVFLLVMRPESRLAPREQTAKTVAQPSSFIGSSPIVNATSGDAVGGFSHTEKRKEVSHTLGWTKEGLTPAATPVPTPPTEPMIARMVSLSIVAKDFTSARATLEAILAKHRGYAASLTVNTQQDSARALVASLRIPAGQLNAAVSELKALGRVQNEKQEGEEVTQQHADLMARLKNSRETEKRLQAILENRTGKISDVLEVEQEIARVRGEIEQMEGEQQGLEHRVSFATVELNLSEEYKAQVGTASPSISTRIHNAMVAGYREAVENLVSIVEFVAEYGPSLLIWAALLAPIAWVMRRRWMRAAAMAESTGL